MYLLHSQLLAAHAIAPNGYGHADLHSQSFRISSQCGPRSIYYYLGLSTHAAVIDRRCDNKPLRLPDKGVELIHIVFDYAFLVLEAIVTVTARADLPASHGKLHSFQALVFQHLESFPQDVLRGHIPGAAGYAEYHDYQ
jgi:hypothetical protein